ncbi:type IV toxin-antitoxin system AbiEi family antitoxin domain-containing protein [Luteibacter sp.]|uniref:type IV toxin-antitoxin system AbiEi family antitoxin domain-containing protein n=1 Tax=Luteibacter sp. TaxID=1886636 RepID=UPI003F7EAD40
MSDSNPKKLNSLLIQLGDTQLVSARWLRTHGYPSNLVVRYVAGGWLVPVARGVYLRAGGRLTWEGAVRTLQGDVSSSVHVGGRFALSLQGHEHYLRLGDAGTVTLYGLRRPPAWLAKLPLEQRFAFMGLGSFDSASQMFLGGVPDAALAERGLFRRRPVDGDGALVCSTVERAMLELCDGVSEPTLVYEIDALMQSMTTLSPQRLAQQLRHCRSIKAKRLFLALAHRHQHAWLPHVPLDGVDLGSGKRALVPGGRLDPTYLITLPTDLDEHLA